MRRIRVACDEGIGLIEIIVALMLLVLLSVAFLPLLITNVRLTQQNLAIGTAADIVHSRMAALRNSVDATSTSCSSLITSAASIFGATMASTTADADALPKYTATDAPGNANVSLQYPVSGDVRYKGVITLKCPTTTPAGLGKFTFTVTGLSAGEPVNATATTLFFLTNGT